MTHDTGTGSPPDDLTGDVIARWRAQHPDEGLLLDIYDTLCGLQAAKQRVYGHSWCKHGETFSIYPNLLRKVDRLMHGGGETPDESYLDTVADLATYAILWCSWLAVHDARVWYDDIVRDTPARHVLQPPASVTVYPFRTIVEQLIGIAGGSVPAEITGSVCQERCLDAACALEMLLVAYGPDAPRQRQVVVHSVYTVAYYAVRWLYHLARRAPAQYAQWRAQWPVLSR